MKKWLILLFVLLAVPCAVLIIDQNNQQGDATPKIQNKNTPPMIHASDKEYWFDQITQEQWEMERMQAVSAEDAEDGDITNNIEIVLDDVNIMRIGTYRVIYQVSDQQGATTQKEVSVRIRHNNKPIITASNLMITKKECMEDQLMELLKSNAHAYDPEDGDLTDRIQVSHDVNVEREGIYTVEYRVIDHLGSETIKENDVTVESKDAAKFQTIAPAKRFIEGEYTLKEWRTQLRMQGVSAHNHKREDITDEIEIFKDTVIAEQEGEYQVIYKVYDRLTQQEMYVFTEVTVERNEAPVIYASDKYFKVTDLITEEDLLKNVYAGDDHDGDLSDQVTLMKNNVKIGECGIYTVGYRVIDRFGKMAIKVIRVHIEDDEQGRCVE